MKKYSIITISGFAGAGKTTLGKLLAKKLNYRFIAPTFKDIAKKEGITLMEFQRRAEKDPDIDKKFDNYIKKEAKSGRCVIATWLAPWMVKNSFKIWVFAPLEIRAKRLAKRDGISIKEAKRHILEREESNRKRYKKVYGIDIMDYSIFDVCLNAKTFKPKEMVGIIMEALKR
ncbi:MAG: cytidylate kinase family protein [Candidatus Anstonellales archaeon]